MQHSQVVAAAVMEATSRAKVGTVTKCKIHTPAAGAWPPIRRTAATMLAIILAEALKPK